MLRLLLLVFCVIASSCSRKPSPTVFVDPALASLVPADTVMLAGLRAEQLAKTQFWQDYVQKRRVQLLEDFRRRTGLDPAKDIWELLAASSAKDALVFVRGKFSEMGLEPKLNLEGAQRLSYKGFTMIGNERNAVLFLNPTTAVAGSTASLRKVVDSRNSVTGLPKDLEERIKKIPSTNQAWVASKVSGVVPDLGSLTEGGGMVNNLARLAQSIQYLSGGVNFSGDFHAGLDIETPNDKAADQISGGLRALLGLGRLNTADKNREVLSVFDGMHVVKEGTLVRFTTDVPYPVLEKAASEMKLFGMR
jgi:hypothetical protein